MRKASVGAVVAGLVLSLSVPTADAAAPGQSVSLAMRAMHANGKAAGGARVLITPMWQATDDVRGRGPAVGRMVTVGPDGQANIRFYLNGAQREAARKNNDWLTLSLVMLNDDGSIAAITNTSRYLGTKADQQAQLAWLPNQGTVELSATQDQAPDGQTQALASCTYYWDVASTTDKYAQYAELHVDSDATRAEITYGVTADSNFDVMVRGQLPDTTYGVSGSVHVGNSQTSTTGSDFGGLSNYHWALRTKFRYYDYRLYKDCVGGPYRYDTGASEILAGEWLGGGSTLANTVAQGTRTSTNSFSYGPGGIFSRVNNQLAKFSGGAFAFGITMGVQSGASTNVRYDYKFGSGRPTHYVYGNGGYPNVATKVYQDTP